MISSSDSALIWGVTRADFYVCEDVRPATGVREKGVAGFEEAGHGRGGEHEYGNVGCLYSCAGDTCERGNVGAVQLRFTYARFYATHTN